MRKTKTIKILVYLLLMSLLLFSINLSIVKLVNAGTITRTGPTTASPSSTFQVSYTTSGVSGTWGATLMETISGGCTINSKSSLNFVMLSDLPNPLTYTVTTPSGGSCTFSGNYQFGTDAIVNFPDLTINLGGTCTPSCSGKICGSDGCNGTCGNCNSNQTCSSGTCQPIVGICTDTINHCGGPCPACQTACSMLAKLCPDGVNSVSQNASNNCQYDSCPTPKVSWDINQPVFVFMGFTVTWLILIIALIVIILIVVMLSK